MAKTRLVQAAALLAAATLGAALVLMLRPGAQMAGGDSAVASAAPMKTDGTASGVKQLWTCGMHPQVIQDRPGTCPICHMRLTPLKNDDIDNTPSRQKKVAYWWDPMLGPASISDHPGKSAMNMDLVPVYEDKVQAGPGIRIDPIVVQNMGVLTAPVTRGPLNLTIRAVGSLEVPEPSMHDVTLKVSGFIEKLYADTQGMSIAQGDVLFDLYSPDIQVAAQELISAMQADRSMDGAGPAVHEESQRMIDSAKRKLRLWDVAEQDIDAIARATRPPRTVPIRSPMSGHIEDKSVVAGSAVQMGMKLMRIEDHRTLWLNAEVYEDQVEAIKTGQQVRATIDGLPGRIFSGQVSFIYPHFNHMTRTEMVRTSLDNPVHALRPGMYATVEIATQPVSDAILIPREAVIDTGSQQISFVIDPMAGGHFLPRNVRLGLVGDDDKVQVVEGLAPGDTVVTSGQFLMDVESRTTEAIQKLRGTTTAPPAGGMSNSMAMPAMQPTAPSTAPAMDMQMAPMPMSTPMPATQLSLFVAHCPMKNADWLQVGDAINNPYYGTAMSTCGSVTRQIAIPPAESPLSTVSSAYLKFTQGLDADRLDTGAQADLKKSVERLQDPKFAPLVDASRKLADAATLADARATLAAESSALLAGIDQAK